MPAPPFNTPSLLVSRPPAPPQDKHRRQFSPSDKISEQPASAIVRIDSKGQFVASPSIVRLPSGRLLVALERCAVLADCLIPPPAAVLLRLLCLRMLPLLGPSTRDPEPLLTDRLGGHPHPLRCSLSRAVSSGVTEETTAKLIHPLSLTDTNYSLSLLLLFICSSVSWGVTKETTMKLIYSSDDGGSSWQRAATVGPMNWPQAR